MCAFVFIFICAHMHTYASAYHTHIMATAFPTPPTLFPSPLGVGPPLVWVAVHQWLRLLGKIHGSNLTIQTIDLI